MRFDMNVDLRNHADNRVALLTSVRYSNQELSLSSDVLLLGNDIVDYIGTQFDGMWGRTETDSHD